MHEKKSRLDSLFPGNVSQLLIHFLFELILKKKVFKLNFRNFCTDCQLFSRAGIGFGFIAI